MRAWGLRPSRGKAPSPPDFEIFQFVFLTKGKYPQQGRKHAGAAVQRGRILLEFRRNAVPEIFRRSSRLLMGRRAAGFCIIIFLPK